MTTWFASDLHMGHKLVAGLRGFGSPDEHDAAICRAWREAVMPDDTIWVLGDVALGDYMAGLERVAGLPGTKHLVLGNHDRCHPGWKGVAAQQDYLMAFDSVSLAERFHLDGPSRPPWMLSHFPYEGDRPGGTERALQWRLRDERVPLIHGHQHQDVIATRSKRGTLQLNVALEATGLKPISAEDLLAVAHANGH